ncbi:MAG: nucleoside hydrolase, partial [Solirubrobacterales bacterium]
MTTPRPLQVVVDCDPGIDDAVALALLAEAEEVELLGVTTVSGNVGVEDSTRNAARVMHLVGRGEVPIAAGASRPLVRDTPPYPPIHGVNGLGEVELPACPSEDGAEPALDLLAAILRAAEPASVTLVALAPLTNLALLLALHPELTDRIDRVLTMAASLDRGNVTPYAEFNVWADPEAAHRVLVESGLPLQVFPLAATKL